MTSIPILNLLQFTQLQLVLLFLGRCCSCGLDDCDICGRRCPLTLNDGNELWFPVLANDGQLYDACELVKYAEYAEWRGDAIASPVHGKDIVSVTLASRTTMASSMMARGCACLRRIEKHRWYILARKCTFVDCGIQTDSTPPCRDPRLEANPLHHPRTMKHLPRVVRANVGGSARNVVPKYAHR